MSRTAHLLAAAALALLLSAAGCRASGPVPTTEPIILNNGQTRVLGIELVEPRFQPALEALQAAVNAGDDREARAVLARLQALGPTGPALDMARGYERILDGRAAVEALDLRCEAVFERPAGGGGMAKVAFTARVRGERQLEVRPGPGVLHVTTCVVDPVGAQTRRVEVVPLPAIQPFAVGADPSGADRVARIDLVEVPIAMPAGALALRLTFDVDLRAGSVRTGAEDTGAAETSRGRDLPAMRWHVEGTEIVLLAKELARLELAQAGDLARAAQATQVDRRTMLAIAVRVPPAERDAALDDLAQLWSSLPETAVAELAPALRWLASDASLGEDAGAWRAFLRERARGHAREPGLLLPRARASELVDKPGGP